jgi:N-acetylmuramoyl-L-alanine amidase
MKRWLLAFIVSLGGAGAVAGTAIEGVRLSDDGTTTRVVLDVAGALRYQVQNLSDQEKVIVELRDAEAAPSIVAAAKAKGFFKKATLERSEKSNVQLVLHVAPNTVAKAFSLGPNGAYGHRVVIDLRKHVDAVSLPATASTAKTKSVNAVASEPKIAEAPRREKVENHTPSSKDTRDRASKPFVVAVDAGHGGKDPGAHGAAGTQEKQVTLAIARKLARLINQEPNMRAVLIRDGDFYIGLRQRIGKARQHKADLFVSIHADAFTRRDAKGSSVYVLSERGATSEAARWIAAQENASDLVGGVSLDDKDQMLASVLLDLSQAATIESSMDLGGHVLKSLGNIGPLHRTRVERAGFMVLKSPDIPSILVETAFISNPDEERKLASSSHQTKLAEAILGGIRGYARRAVPVRQQAPALRTAENEAIPVSPAKATKKVKAVPPPKPLDKRAHMIEPGDTLDKLSQRYQVSRETIKIANNLPTEDLSVGRVIEIPN